MSSNQITAVFILILMVCAIVPAMAADFFDDFNYASGGPATPIDPQFRCFGWYVRTEGGGPGAAGVTWRADYVTWADDPAVPGNRVMRLRASTDGTGRGTFQSEVDTDEELFFEGTYGVRIKFTDVVPGAAQPSVQAFSTYKGLVCDLNYSECDIEYTPLDPWSTRCGSLPALHLQTWERYCENPFLEDKLPTTPSPICGTLAGWHTYTIQIGGGAVRYYVDGLLKANHGGAYYPESSMRLLLLHWFANQLTPGVSADMTMEVDWVYYAKNTILTTAQVEGMVAQYRTAGITRRNGLATFPDCNANAVPDYCELDSDGDGIIDECDTSKVWRVKWDATGAQNGTTWNDAFTMLQAALAVAKPGDEIWVSAGTYKPAPPGGNRNLAFQLVPGVAIYGGFTGTETHREQRDPVSNVTVLSGDLNGNDNPTFVHNEENSYVVVNASATDSASRIEGFTITGANGTLGGGLYMDGGNLVISNCRFIGNMAVWGGAVCMYESNPQIRRCFFVGNNATTDGGALYVNLGSNPLISTSVFERNTAGYAGGAARVLASSPTVISCIFRSNHAQYAAAIQYYECSGPMLANSLLYGNQAVVTGGAIQNNNSTPLIVNCTIAHNSAGLEGGGVHGWWPSLATIVNSIIWGNSDYTGSGEQAQVTTDTAGVSFSCVQNWTGLAGGYAVSAADPVFVDPGGADNIPGTEDDNYRLRKESPFIDAGDNTMLPPDLPDLDADGNTSETIALDVAGYRRLEDALLVADTGFGASPLVDLGPYEYVPVSLADFDYDRDVDTVDFLHLQSCALGPVIPQVDAKCRDADLDDDGDVDQTDFGILQTSYGTGE